MSATISDARVAHALGLTLPPSRTWCPECGAFYFLIKAIGSPCGDLSRGQAAPCPGIVDEYTIVPDPEPQS